jgi:hypothetical protein
MHSTFSASLDRIEIDGNVFGPQDGVADVVDEFDDGALGPDWKTTFGSITEAGGLVTFHNPGMDLPYTPGIDVSMMSYDVAAPAGAGSYTVTAVWAPTLPATDRRFHVQLIGHGNGILDIESAGISVTNLARDTASAYWPAARSGFAISQESTELDDGYAAPELVTYYAVPVTAASITGSIVLRLTVDDVAKTLTTSFSLDGGTTFQSPFPPVGLFRLPGIGEHEIHVGAAAVQTGSPPHPTQYLGVRAFEIRSTPSLRKLQWHAKQFNVPLWDDPVAAGVTLNLVVDGATRCFRMPAGGWRELHYARYAYVDRAGAYGPVRKARLTRGPGYTFDARVQVVGTPDDVGLAPPNRDALVDSNFEVGGLTDYCSSSAGGRIRVNNERAFKLQDAPPPAACGVSACTP